MIGGYRFVVNLMYRAYFLLCFDQYISHKIPQPFNLIDNIGQQNHEHLIQGISVSYTHKKKGYTFFLMLDVPRLTSFRKIWFYRDICLEEDTNYTIF